MTIAQMRQPRERSNPARALIVIAAVLAITPAVKAADPQPYTLNIGATGNGALDSALKGSSQLESLRQKAPVAPFALVGRAEQDVMRLQTVLESYGYYQGRVRITVDGRSLDDPGLPEALAALPAGQNAAVVVAVDLGPLYHIGQATIDGDVPADAQDKLGIASGAPAVAADIEAARGRLLTGLEEEGYALAKVDAPIAYEDPAAHALNITFKAEAGPRVDVGEIRIVGLVNVHEGLVRKRLLLHTGEQYSPSKIERARKDLLSLNVFSGVTVRAGDQLDASGRLPITFEVRERPRHAVGFNGAYSSDLGISAGASWSNRNLFGNGEQLNLSASVINLGGGSATTGLGYNSTVQLIKPDFLVRDQSLEARVGALQQNLEAYDQTAATAGVFLNRKLSPTWSGSVGLTAIEETIKQQGVTTPFTLFALPTGLKYDSTGVTNPLDDPMHGMRASLSVAPTLSVGHGRADRLFTIVQGSAATYFDLNHIGIGEPGRSIIAMRGFIGTAIGASQSDLPPDQRFYGGGSNTVRGYRYQSIGPQFPDGTPAGGTSIDAGTVEFRQRIRGSFGAAVFVDAGQVSANGPPFQGSLHFGVGAGVRYYTPIGAVRIDFAVPVNKLPGGDAFEVYIGLGPVF